MASIDTPAALPRGRTASTTNRGAAALSGAVRFWFLVTVAGQAMFAAYMAVLYGASAALGDFARWNTLMPRGHVPGATVGNAATGVHLLAAAFLMLSGALQLLPALRRHAPAVHRWNGRLYLVASVGAGVTGMYMIWWRGAAGGIVQHLGTSLNGVLLVLCAGMALRRILAGDAAAHRRWALRLYLCVSGVWFFRVGLMFWIAANGGPAGFDPATFTGPFLDFLAFAQTLLPLAVLELYLACRTRSGAAQWAMALLLALLTLAMAAGIGVAAAGMWLPHMWLPRM